MMFWFLLPPMGITFGGTVGLGVTTTLTSCMFVDGCGPFIMFIGFLLLSVTGLEGRKEPLSSQLRFGGGGHKNGDNKPNPSSCGLISTILRRISAMLSAPLLLLLLLRGGICGVS